MLWFIFKILYFAQVFAVGLFVPLYAAEWFGGCLEADNITPFADCSPDYTQYAFWSTLFFSRLITFLSSPLAGHLSDVHCRKPFFFLAAVLTWMIPRLVMLFHIDFFIYSGSNFQHQQGVVRDMVLVDKQLEKEDNGAVSQRAYTRTRCPGV